MRWGHKAIPDVNVGWIIPRIVEKTNRKIRGRWKYKAQNCRGAKALTHSGSLEMAQGSSPWIPAGGDPKGKLFQRDHGGA